ncbi:uncharacterized protein HMPREF1541_06043 [Cyphellophora europaea CBS 101466]|uniref:Cytochrome P450 n=1 Tax=Cyphellophora europaea (strain CBS 101466) TaxID=1220924 RepID=W2RTP6_CYPE1|nr:uncharacterized protein HMPREF1541_06043 [Cyphellophora europaea CBS 101466]ETN39817.1 hypothetical protein HMPREF1541_06043 [Cyphellophora europaea CBS 101466]
MYSYLALVGLLVLGLLTKRLLTHLRHQRLAREAGCKPAPRRAHRLPFGIDLIRELMTADAVDEVPIHFERLTDKMAPAHTWEQHLLGRMNFMTVEPANIKAILATQFKDFSLGPQRKGSLAPMFAHGIFSDDGERWERSRALIRPSFARDQLANVEVLEVHVQNLMRAINANLEASGWTGNVNLVPLFFRLTLDSSTETLFGQSVNSQLSALTSHQDASALSAEDLQWQNFGPAFDGATEEVTKRFRLNSMYWLHDTKALRDQCAEVHRFADHFVRLALQPASEKDPERGEQKQPYVFLHELAKSTQDPTELRDQLLNVLLAGRDTTANLLSFTFYQLARHPTVLSKLRKSILSDFGTYTNPHTLDFTTLKACTYLQHVLNESLRLHPAVPINSRRAVKDTTLPLGGGPDFSSPIFIPKGTEVGYSVHAMQRRTDLWGADAHDFNPERWVGRKAGWEFLPFNGGPRICLGQQAALTTAGYTTVRLLQRFDQLADLVPHNLETGRERYWCALTDAPVHVNVRIHEAAAAAATAAATA